MKICNSLLSQLLYIRLDFSSFYFFSSLNFRVVWLLPLSITRDTWIMLEILSVYICIYSVIQWFYCECSILVVECNRQDSAWFLRDCTDFGRSPNRAFAASLVIAAMKGTGLGRNRSRINANNSGRTNRETRRCFTSDCLRFYLRSPSSVASSPFRFIRFLVPRDYVARRTIVVRHRDQLLYVRDSANYGRWR